MRDRQAPGRMEGLKQDSCEQTSWSVWHGETARAEDSQKVCDEERHQHLVETKAAFCPSVS